MSTLTVQTPAGRTLTVGSLYGEEVPSNRFAAELVGNVLKLCRINEEVSSFRLFFFAREFWNFKETFGYRYKFFVVHGDKIVLDDFELSSLCDDYFEPRILEPTSWREDSESLAGDAEHASGDRVEEEKLTFEQQRGLAWWYRRFYTKTRTGQVQVHWNKGLFHYTPPEHREAKRDSRLRRIEWVVLGIAGLLIGRFILRWF